MAALSPAALPGTRASNRTPPDEREQHDPAAERGHAAISVRTGGRAGRGRDERSHDRVAPQVGARRSRWPRSTDPAARGHPLARIYQRTGRRITR